MGLHGTVVDTTWPTPSMVRIVLGGDGLADYQAVDATDGYVNVAFPPAGAPYVAPFDLDEVQSDLPRQLWPVRRRYTVRRWDATRRLLTLDILSHGDEGAGGRWAATARPGDVLVFTGPSGGYRPDPAAAWHLMVGDESALPAIAASLEVVPADVPVVVRLLAEHLLADRGVVRADLSCSPYWRRHLTDEDWRRVKADWVADVERDVA